MRGVVMGSPKTCVVSRSSISRGALWAVALGASSCVGPAAIAPSAQNDAGVCGPFSALEGLSISPGGRVQVTREGGLNGEALTFSTSEGLSATLTEQKLTLRATYEFRGGTLTAHCATGSQHAARVAVRPLEWTNVAEWQPAQVGPPGREYGGWWVDAVRERLFVFGGFHYEPRQFTPANDLWSFDLVGATWSRTTTTAPVTAPGGRVARGPGPNEVLYFGGATRMDDGALATLPTLQVLTAQGPQGDEVRFEAAAHEEQTPGTYTGAFVYDAPRNRWLSICGADRRSGIHCNVDAYSVESGWMRLRPTGARPEGRYGFHYALDEENERVIIVAGQTGAENLEMIGDTWALELAGDVPQWVKLVEDREDIRRRNGAFVLDPAGHRLLLSGGTADGDTSVPGLFALSLDRGSETWSVVEVPGEMPVRTSGIAVYDAKRRRALVGFGNGDRVYTDLWALSL